MTMSDKFVGVACSHHMLLVQYVIAQLLKIKKYHATKKKEADRCRCSLQRPIEILTS
jgi:hypothetical protein